MIKEIFKMSLEICRTKWIYHFLLQLNVGGLGFFFLKMAARFSVIFLITEQMFRKVFLVFCCFLYAENIIFVTLQQLRNEPAA